MYCTGSIDTFTLSRRLPIRHCRPILIHFVWFLILFYLTCVSFFLSASGSVPLSLFIRGCNIKRWMSLSFLFSLVLSIVFEAIKVLAISWVVLELLKGESETCIIPIQFLSDRLNISILVMISCLAAFTLIGLSSIYIHGIFTGVRDALFSLELLDNKPIYQPRQSDQKLPSETRPLRTSSSSLTGDL